MAGLSAAASGIVDDHQVLQVLVFLGPKSALCVRETSKTGSFARVAGSKELWLAALGRVFGLSGKEASRFPGSQKEDSEEEDDPLRMYQRWHAAARDVGLQDASSSPMTAPLPARWVAAWSRLQRWLRKQAPEIEATLRPPYQEEHAGITLEEIFPDCDVHPLVKGLWSVHDGQMLFSIIQEQLGLTAYTAPDSRCRRPGPWQGLFGSYTVYDHHISLMLLPLEAALGLTALLREKVFREEQTTKLAFAVTLTPRSRKFVFVDVVDGMVYCWPGDSKDLLPMVPRPGAALTADEAKEGLTVRLAGLSARPELNGCYGTLGAFDEGKGRWQVSMKNGSGTHLLKRDNLRRDVVENTGDGLLRWFEEYARRLEEGVYERKPVMNESPEDSVGICLFPACGAEVSRCVTQGVEVVASCVYTPEAPQQGWAYSIAFRLVGTAAERGYETCQLTTRTWRIQASDDEEPDIVNGEGVIGFFPILTDGGWICNSLSDPHQQYGESQGFREGQFRYQSCSGRKRGMRGSFGGTLRFVPGNRKKPTGKPFDAVLEPFKLYIPEFIF